MVHTHGWVRRKVKKSDKWVRRWIEVNKHVLYSYQSCPADMPSARVMNMLDLRKTRTIDVVDGEEGLFVIVSQSSDDAHPGYLMKRERLGLGCGPQRRAGPRDREEWHGCGAPAGELLLLALLWVEEDARARPARAVLGRARLEQQYVNT